MTDLAALLPPPVLFFALGAAAAALRADLLLPDALTKTLSIYLMLAIGLKGGFALHGADTTAGLGPALLAGLLLSLALPIPAFLALRATTRLDRATVAAAAGHYGSVSVVTYAAAAAMLDNAGVPTEGFMPAVLAVMEAPAILVALLLARDRGAALRGGTLREVLLSGPILLLFGSFGIGWIAAEPARVALRPFVDGQFPGALCLFLLGLGALAMAQLRAGGRGVPPGAIACALLLPPLQALAGIGAGWAIGLSPGGVGLLAVLAASASYIAAPAAMRLALPQADAGVYLTMSVALTFPLNVTLGIPLYLRLAGAL